MQTQRNGLGGRVADSLRQTLLLLKDMKYWLDYRDEDIALNLKWHTIAVSTPDRDLSFLPVVPYFIQVSFRSSYLTSLFLIICFRPLKWHTSLKVGRS